jgi:hypothetical protein
MSVVHRRGRAGPGVRGGAPLGPKARSSCRRAERGLVTECRELTDKVPGPAVRVEALLVEVGAEVDEVCLEIVDEEPDDDKDRACDGNEGALAATPASEATVTLSQERVGARRGAGHLAHDALQIGVVVAGTAAFAPWSGLDRAWCELRPGHQVGGSWELGHVEPDLGDDELGGARLDAGHLQPSTVSLSASIWSSSIRASSA